MFLIIKVHEKVKLERTLITVTRGPLIVTNGTAFPIIIGSILIWIN